METLNKVSLVLVAIRFLPFIRGGFDSLSGMESVNVPIDGFANAFDAVRHSVTAASQPASMRASTLYSRVSEGDTRRTLIWELHERAGALLEARVALRRGRAGARKERSLADDTFSRRWLREGGRRRRRPTRAAPSHPSSSLEETAPTTTQVRAFPAVGKFDERQLESSSS